MRQLFLLVFIWVFVLAAAVIVREDFAYAVTGDLDPPIIDNVSIQQVDETTFKVTWETDENADSLVNYGLQRDYGIVRDPLPDRTTHEIVLDSLQPGTKYHFRIVSADEEGNQGISSDFQFRTPGDPQEGVNSDPQVQDPTENQVEVQTQQQTQEEIVEEAIEAIQQIQTTQKLEEVLEVVLETISGITDDLTIVGPPTVVAETTTATVTWTTDRPSDSTVLFSPADQYVEGGAYTFSQNATDGLVTDHEVQLIGLDPFTEYHFRVESTDQVGITGRSDDFTFRTKATLPRIRNLRIVKVEENSATFAWDTTVPASALVEYQDLSTGEENSKGRPSLATTHQMRIADLTLGTRYVAVVTAENGGGDRVKSDPITFITVRDIEPPIISNVTNESTLFPGSEARIQTIIEWQTDEPTFCDLTYREGLAPGVEEITLEREDESLTQQHVEVIINFTPATVYQFWLTCTDEAGNSARSEDFVLFTPIKEKSIIDIIIENFEGTFGWVKNIGA